MLTPAQQGILLICALDKLPFLGDYLNPELDVDGCCPDCCAQCGLVRDVDRAGQLDDIITEGPSFLWSQSAWWRKSKVDRVWLYAVWDCQFRPNCKTDEVFETYTLDHVAERFARAMLLTVPEAHQLLTARLTYEDELTTHVEQLYGVGDKVLNPQSATAVEIP